MNDPLWYKNAVFYELYIRAFCDSNGDGHGDLPGLTSKLDYLKDLGIDCVWLLPFYPSPLNDDGYDIADYYNIHPDYGTLDDFKAFVAAAHQRGLRVITDLVLNHTSDQHAWFQAARADRNSPYRDYYVWSDTDDKYKDVRIIFIDTEKSNWAWDEVAGQYFWHRFYSTQPDLNYDNPAVCDEMLNVVKFWLNLGVDGFRVDAVPYMFEREGTNCENLPETHAYLKELRSYIETHYPGRILLGEANQQLEEVLAYFGDGDEFHMNFHFPIMPRLYLALRRGDRTPIVEVLENTPAIPDNAQWCIFLRNHDELTLEMVTEEERQWLWQEYAPEPRMRSNLGIRRRLAPLVDNDMRKIALLNSLLFTLPGSPIIYYGDEIGMGDNIWLSDRNGVRTPMQWTADDKTGFSDAIIDNWYAPVINASDYGPQQVNVAGQRANPGGLWHLIRRMIAVRQQHAALGEGRLVWAKCDSTAAVAYVRQHTDGQVLVLHNLADRPQTIDVTIAGGPWAAASSILGKLPAHTLSAEELHLTLAAYQYLWLKLSPA